MKLQLQIEEKLTQGLELKHLEVINESANHNVPPGSESHFKVVLVSDDFIDLTLIRRHRCVNQILSIELAKHIHALAIHTYTAEEWRKKTNGAPLSPPCLGGLSRRL